MNIPPKYVFLFLVLGTILRGQEILPLIPELGHIKTEKPQKTSLYLSNLLQHIETNKKNNPPKAKNTVFLFRKTKRHNPQKTKAITPK